jgi:hypothetical protein
MPDGKAQRAQIDTETVRALLLVHGGGAVALLAVLKSFIESDEYYQFTRPILSSILIFMGVIHDQHGGSPPPGKVLGRQLKEPTVCFFSIAYMWISIFCIVGAGIVLGISGMRIVSPDAAHLRPAVSGLAALMQADGTNWKKIEVEGSKEK